MKQVVTLDHKSGKGISIDVQSPLIMNLPPAGANCTDPPPTALLYQSVSVDPACTYAGCTATYTCNEGLTLSDGRTTYQLTCMQGGHIFNASWETNAQTCCKLYSGCPSCCVPINAHTQQHIVPHEPPHMVHI